MGEPEENPETLVQALEKLGMSESMAEGFKEMPDSIRDFILDKMIQIVEGELGGNPGYRSATTEAFDMEREIARLTNSQANWQTVFNLIQDQKRLLDLFQVPGYGGNAPILQGMVPDRLTNMASIATKHVKAAMDARYIQKRIRDKYQ